VKGLKGGQSVREFALAEMVQRHSRKTWRIGMLWTVVVTLLILWLLGMVTSYTLYGFIHILLVIALVVLVMRL
jgi:hypothetical protein